MDITMFMIAVNGCSFAVTAAKASNKSLPTNHAVIDWLLGQEEPMELDTPRPYREFEERVFRHREDLTRLIRTLKAGGKKIFGYCASTKGNVVLQFCGLPVEWLSLELHSFIQHGLTVLSKAKKLSKMPTKGLT